MEYFRHGISSSDITIKGVNMPDLEKQIEDAIHLSEICKIANKNTPWYIRRSRKKALMESIMKILKDNGYVKLSDVRVDRGKFLLDCVENGVPANIASKLLRKINILTAEGREKWIKKLK